jgi:uncharacterized protein HemX
MKQITQKEQPEKSEPASAEATSEVESAPKKRGYLLVLILFFIVVAGLAAAAYQGWILFNNYQQQNQSRLDELQSQLDQRASSAQLESSISSLRRSIDQTASRLPAVEQGQRDLIKSVEKLFALYARDKNGWKLSEVEYLMSVAQHKLILESDFEGAARTLNAASERIAELADPGLLPVRVRINEEITQLKTRSRPDLVGMTLTLSRLARQISTLKPGYRPKPEEQAEPTPAPVAKAPADMTRELDKKLIEFMTSLVTIKSAEPKAKPVEQVMITDVREHLQDNLKLTRWAVLDRDATQYLKLMEQNVNLFSQNYDLENAANADFFQSLQQLQKSPIHPDLPDITVSLRLLKEIQTRREAPVPATTNSPEANNG